MTGLPLTLDVIRAAYELLRATPPFRRWGLPPSAEITFRVTRHVDCFGQCWSDGVVTGIDISEQKVGQTKTLLETMAHEMVHLWQLRSGRKLSHNAEFKRRAAIVCRHHGFDPNAF